MPAGGLRTQSLAALLQRDLACRRHGLRRSSHFLDDYFYQARERTRCLVEDLPALGLMPTEGQLPEPGQAAAVEARVCDRIARATANLREVFIRSGLVREVHVEDVYLPWQRLFEVGFDVRVEPN